MTIVIEDGDIEEATEIQKKLLKSRRYITTIIKEDVVVATEILKKLLKSRRYIKTIVKEEVATGTIDFCN